MTALPPFRVLVIVLAPLLAAAAAAGDGSAPGFMSESELKSVFSGVTVEGEYPSGASFTEVYGGDGRVAYEDEQRKSGGRWSIASGTFCTIYDDDPAGGCFRVRKAGANCFEFFFSARTEAEAPGAQPKDQAWSARAWLSDKDSTCQEEIGA